MRVFRYADYRESPWKNGGGVTREIARAIDDGPDFLWRLSLADVHRSGPFSLFPGHERTIMLVEGDGISLT